MTPDDFLSRLSAGLDRDEQLARAAAEGWHVNVVDGGEATGAIGGDAYDLLLAQNPDRMLRQVEAIRKVLSEHQDDDHGFCITCHDYSADYGVPWPCPTVRALASIYADPAEENV